MEDLLKPWSLAGLTLRNRLLMAPVKTAFGTPDGRVTERHLHFYRAVARGGVGLVILEPVPVRWEGREHPKQLAVTHAESAEELRGITAVIHEHGAKVALNLNHAGRAANPGASGREPVAPSACECPAKRTKARAMSLAEIEETVQAFGQAAAVAEAAGFDIVEIQAGHGYLLQQFLDREVNRREDAYGAGTQRFALEVLEAVRAACPLPLSVRVTLNDPGDRQEASRLQGFLRAAEAAGVALVHVGMGDACLSPAWYYHHGSLPMEPQEAVVRLVRSLTSLPLAVAGRMGDLARARRVLDEGMADAIALGRPLVADPELPAKWQAGAESEVVGCGYCLQGCLAKVATGEGLSCVVNPAVGKGPLARTKKGKRVLVAGAGPAGLSAALTLWERGHGVIVAEAGTQAGGTFVAAPRSPGKESMRRPLEGLLAAITRARIPVMTERVVDRAFLEKVHPEVLVWAVGGKAVKPPIPGLDRVACLTSQEYYVEERPLPGRRVLILGGGLVGLEAAEKLAIEGREVVVVEMLAEMAANMEPVGRGLLMQRLEALPEVTLLVSSTVLRVGPDALVLQTPAGERRLPPVEAVLLAAGLRPRRLPEIFKEIVSEIHVIGDACEPRDIEAATREGYEAGMKV